MSEIERDAFITTESGDNGYRVVIKCTSIEEMQAAHRAVIALQESGTPAARWRENGEPDPHGDMYNQERSRLCMGHATDDELANEVYLKPTIGNLTAAKERIRWLSRRAEVCADQTKALARILIDSVRKRDPDFVIGDPDDPYMIRWWLRRDRSEGSIYLHQIRKSDDDRALHDHPWPSTSIILSGTLREIVPDGSRILTPGSITSRAATDAHRLEVVDGPVWTLFVTGAVEREWGFHCPNGWIHWQDFTDADSGGARTGRGCGEQDDFGSVS